MKLRLRRLCAIFWTWRGGVHEVRVYVSKADYPPREKEWERVRAGGEEERSGNHSGSLGEIARASFQHPPDWLWLRARPYAWEMLPCLTLFPPRPIARSFRSTGRPTPDRIRTIPLSPLSTGRTFEFVFVSGMSAEAFSRLAVDSSRLALF